MLFYVQQQFDTNLNQFNKMKNVDIAHHPFRGDFTVFLDESVKDGSIEPYFKMKQNRVDITDGLICLSARGMRIQKRGQGVYLEPPQVRKIKVGWRKIWPENKFLQMIRVYFAKIIGKLLLD